MQQAAVAEVMEADAGEPQKGWAQQNPLLANFAASGGSVATGAQAAVGGG
jgi:hypothetical protein